MCCLTGLLTKSLLVQHLWSVCVCVCVCNDGLVTSILSQKSSCESHQTMPYHTICWHASVQKAFLSSDNSGDVIRASWAHKVLFPSEGLGLCHLHRFLRQSGGKWGALCAYPPPHISLNFQLHWEGSICHLGPFVCLWISRGRTWAKEERKGLFKKNLLSICLFYANAAKVGSKS